MNPHQHQNNSSPDRNKNHVLLPLLSHQYLGDEPPAQVGHVQARSNRKEERQAIVVKITKLDREFKTLFLDFYQMWLCLKVILSTIILLFANIPVQMVIFFMITTIWNASQAQFGMDAISQRNLKKANNACWMVCIGLVPWVILEIFFIEIVATQDDWYGLYKYLVGVIGLITLIHIGLGVNGAFTVRRLLIDRGILQEKLNEIVKAEENRELKILVHDT